MAKVIASEFLVTLRYLVDNINEVTAVADVMRQFLGFPRFSVKPMLA
jgi:hypothetical protein